MFAGGKSPPRAKPAKDTKLTAAGLLEHACQMYSSGRTEEAELCFRACAHLDEGSPYACHNMACCCCQRGDMKEAARWLRLAVGRGLSAQDALSDPDLQPVFAHPQLGPTLQDWLKSSARGKGALSVTRARALAARRAKKGIRRWAVTDADMRAVSYDSSFSTTPARIVPTPTPVRQCISPDHTHACIGYRLYADEVAARKARKQRRKKRRQRMRSRSRERTAVAVTPGSGAEHRSMASMVTPMHARPRPHSAGPARLVRSSDATVSPGVKKLGRRRPQSAVLRNPRVAGTLSQPSVGMSASRTRIEAAPEMSLPHELLTNHGRQEAGVGAGLDYLAVRYMDVRTRRELSKARTRARREYMEEAECARRGADKEVIRKHLVWLQEQRDAAEAERLRREAAALSIQCAQRSKVARDHTNRRRTGHRAAVNVQRRWRGRCDRQRASVAAKTRLRNAHAVQVQRRWRGVSVRRTISWQQTAAIVLQRMERGRNARRRVAMRKAREAELHARRDAASAAIAQEWRAHLYRGYLRRRESSALCIQRVLRGMLGRQCFMQVWKKPACAIIIQRYWRGRLGKARAKRRKLKLIRRAWRRRAEASRRIQTMWRGLAARGELRERVGARCRNSDCGALRVSLAEWYAQKGLLKRRATSRCRFTLRIDHGSECILEANEHDVGGHLLHATSDASQMARIDVVCLEVEQLRKGERVTVVGEAFVSLENAPRHKNWQLVDTVELRRPGSARLAGTVAVQLRWVRHVPAEVRRLHARMLQ